MKTDQDEPKQPDELTTEQVLANIEAAKRAKPTAKPDGNETTAEQILASIEAAKRTRIEANHERPTRRDGYLGCFVI